MYFLQIVADDSNPYLFDAENDSIQSAVVNANVHHCSDKAGRKKRSLLPPGGGIEVTLKVPPSPTQRVNQPWPDRTKMLTHEIMVGKYIHMPMEPHSEALESLPLHV